MKKRVLAALLAAMLLLSLAACGGTSSESESTQTEQTETQGTESAQSAEADAESGEQPSGEAQEEASETAQEETTEEAQAASSVSYPIEGDYTFTMTSVTRMNVAEALGDDDYSVTLTYAALAEATGVEIQFEMLSETTYLETLNLRLASQDYPDMFSQTVGSYDSNLQSAIEQEIIIDMADYLEYAPDWAALLESDEDYYNAIVNGDGSLGKIANKALGKITQMGYVRGDWLEELGLESPTTLEELTDVLRAFKEHYNTTNTLLINSDLNSPAEFAFNFTAMGFKMLSFQLTEPGSEEVICGLATDAYVDYLEYLHSLYAEGLITDDFLNISKENGNFESAFYSGEAGAWTDDCKFADTAYAAMASDPDWVAQPFVFSGEDYHMTNPTVAGLTTISISTACEAPEAAMQFLNYGFTEEGRMLIAYGVEGETYTIDEAGNISYTDLILNNPEGYTYDQATVMYLASNWMPYEAEERSLSITYTEPAVDAINLWTDEGGDSAMTIPAAAALTADEMIQVFQLSSDVLTHLSTVAPAVIVGSATADDYRAAVEQANDMGLAEITAIYQAAYDRYLDTQ